jgi:phage major head subunit gpT-like protein
MHRKLLQLAEDSLEAVGVKTRTMSPMDIAAEALNLRSTHTTSDFPLILADVSGKTLRDAYTEAPATFAPLARQITLPDFKSVKRNQLGEAPQLLKVIEGAEFTRGTVGEGKEEFALSTYGRVFAITRQAIVNDDMDAFSRLPMLFGRSARDLESDLVWAEITANANMGDGVALFHATHNNLAGAGAVISITTIGAGRTAMRKQKGVNAKQFVNSQAKYLVVPAALETVAEQFVSTNLLANASGSVNPFAGRLQVIAEPRLDANSLISWYMAADPSQIDLIEYAYLLGEDGPTLESRVGFDVDGLEIKCRHDFAAKVIDYRGLYKNPGA